MITNGFGVTNCALSYPLAAEIGETIPNGSLTNNTSHRRKGRFGLMIPAAQIDFMTHKSALKLSTLTYFGLYCDYLFQYYILCLTYFN